MTSIITGDIINSRNVDSSLWLPKLKAILNAIGKAPNTWEIYRGDSFQIEIKEASKALFFALQLKTTIKQHKGLDVRIAIGIGTKNNTNSTITEANGEAFINSGYAFDNLLKKQTIAIKSPWKNIDNQLNVSLALALLTIDNWTVNSAEFVAAFLQNPNVTQKVIAKQLQISESSASERRKRAGLDEIMQLEGLYSIMITEKIASL